MLVGDRSQQRRDAVEQQELLALGEPGRRRDSTPTRIGELGNQPGEGRAVRVPPESQLVERGSRRRSAGALPRTAGMGRSIPRSSGRAGPLRPRRKRRGRTRRRAESFRSRAPRRSSRPRACRRERPATPVQLLEFGAATDQRCRLVRGQRRRQRNPALDGRFPLDLTVPSGSENPFKATGPQWPEAESAPRPDERPHQLGGEDLAALGGFAQPFGDDHRRTEIVALISDRLADVQAHPDLEPVVDLARVVPVDRLLDPYRAARRPRPRSGTRPSARRRDSSPPARRALPRRPAAGRSERGGVARPHRRRARREEPGRADEVGEQQCHDRAGDPAAPLPGPRWSRVELSVTGAGAGLASLSPPRRSASASSRVACDGTIRSSSRSRGSSRSYALIAAARSPAGGQPPHQLSLRLLGERIERHLPARVVDRAPASLHRASTRRRAAPGRPAPDRDARRAARTPSRRRARQAASPRQSSSASSSLSCSTQRSNSATSVHTRSPPARPTLIAVGDQIPLAVRPEARRNADSALRRLVRALSSSTSGQNRAASRGAGMHAPVERQPAEQRPGALLAGGSSAVPSSSIAKSPSTRTLSIARRSVTPFTLISRSGHGRVRGFAHVNEQTPTSRAHGGARRRRDSSLPVSSFQSRRDVVRGGIHEPRRVRRCRRTLCWSISPRHLRVGWVWRPPRSRAC